MNLIKRKALKNAFLKVVGENYLYHKANKAHVCLSQARLIQLEWAKHRKGGIKTLIEEYTSKKNNRIPLSVWNKYYEQRKKFEQRQMLDWAKIGIPKCITYIEKEDFNNVKDGRARALFILARFYSYRMTAEELYTKLCDWNKYRLRGHLRYNQIKSCVKSVYRSGRKIRLPLGYIKLLFDELGVDMDYSDCEVSNEKK